MRSVIELNGLEFYSYHGVTEQERKVGNTFMVDVRMEVDVPKAILFDLLSETVNYAEVYSVIKKEMNHPSQLLEHVAGRMMTAIRKNFSQKVKKITISIAKINPPLGEPVKEAKVTLSA